MHERCFLKLVHNGLPLAVSGGLEKTDFRLTTKFNNMHRPDEYPIKPPLQQTAVMRSASEVLSRLEEAEKELEYHQEWYKKARENYDSYCNLYYIPLQPHLLS